MLGTVKVSYPKSVLFKRVVGSEAYYIDNKSRLITRCMWIGPHPQISKKPGRYIGWKYPIKQTYGHIPDCEQMLYDGGVKLEATDILYQSKSGLWRLFIRHSQWVFVNELHNYLFTQLYGEHIIYRQEKVAFPITVEGVLGIAGQTMPAYFDPDPLAAVIEQLKGEQQ